MLATALADDGCVSGKGLPGPPRAGCLAKTKFVLEGAAACHRFGVRQVRAADRAPAHRPPALVLDEVTLPAPTRRSPLEIRFAPNSPLEGDGFEPPVPLSRRSRSLRRSGRCCRRGKRVALKRCLSCGGPRVRDPSSSSGESHLSLPELLSLVCLDCGYRGKTLTGIAPEVYY